MNHSTRFRNRLFHLGEIDSRSLNRYLDALSLLVDLLKSAVHTGDPIEKTETFGQFDDRRMMRFQNIQNQSLDIAQLAPFSYLFVFLVDYDTSIKLL